MRGWALSLAAACDYSRTCAWPRGSVYTSDFGGADEHDECCAVMPPHFLTPQAEVGRHPAAGSS